MEIYTVISKQIDNMYNEVFLPSLKKVEPDSEVNAVRIEFEGTGGIRTKGWYQAGWEKIRTLEKVSRRNNDEVIAFFDTDIIFLRPFYQDVLKLMENKDILIQRHYKYGKKLNLGVVFIKCNKKVNSYLNFVIKQRKQENSWDEDIMDKTIESSGLKFDLLPLTFSNESNEGFTQNSYLYHANELGNTFFSTSVQKKYKKLKKLYKKYYLKRRLF